jgi:hypothetical protein
MRCPYCRQIMADTDARCVRCGAVDQGGRWVRSGTAAGITPARPRVDPVDVPIEPPPGQGHDDPGAGAGAGAAGRGSAPVPEADRPTSGRGCLVAGAVVVLVGLALVIGAVVAVVAANHDRSGSSSGPSSGSSSPAAPSAWSTEAEGRFEAACRATGTDADSCRCVRVELELRFTEQQVDAMVAVTDRGDPLSPAVEARLREAERACGAA